MVQVVGIELLGYRKRLLYGISELCRGHPDWRRHSLPSHEVPSTKPVSVGHIYSHMYELCPCSHMYAYICRL